MNRMKSRDERLSFATSVLILVLVLALITQFTMGTYLGRFQPHSFLLYIPTDMPGDTSGWCRDHHWGVHFFGDFQSVYCKSITRAPYEGPFPGSYFPAAYLLMMPLEVFGEHYWLMFASWTAFGVVLLVVSTHRLLQFTGRKGWVTCTALCLVCWPVVAALDRGNIQIYVVALILLGVARDENKRNFLSPVAMGIGAGFKGYPLIFSVVFIKRREWAKLATCWGTFGVLNLCSLFLMRGGVYNNIQTFLRQVRSFSGAGSGTFDDYSRNFLSGNSSLKALFISIEQLTVWNLSEVGKYGLANYRVIVLAVLVTVTMALIWLKLPYSRLLYLLATTPLLTIGLSAQYSLLLLLIPICVWCVDFQKEVTDMIGVYLLVAAAVVMAPISIPLSGVNFDPITGVAVFTSVSVGSLIRPLLLSLIIGSVVVEGIINLIRSAQSPGSMATETSLGGLSEIVMRAQRHLEMRNDASN